MPQDTEDFLKMFPTGRSKWIRSAEPGRFAVLIIGDKYAQWRDWCRWAFFACRR